MSRYASDEALAADVEQMVQAGGGMWTMLIINIPDMVERLLRSLDDPEAAATEQEAMLIEAFLQYAVAVRQAPVDAPCCCLTCDAPFCHPEDAAGPHDIPAKLVVVVPSIDCPATALGQGLCLSCAAGGDEDTLKRVLAALSLHMGMSVSLAHIHPAGHA
jgi:hypothetical protein